MSPVTEITSQNEFDERAHIKSNWRTRIMRSLIIVLVMMGVVVAWQLLNAYNNSTDPTVAGRPLSNPHTHLHIVALGEKPGVLYLGTHYGLFTSTDSGHSWPQTHGALNNYMVTAIALHPSDFNVLALMVIPTSGLGQQPGIAFSRDSGKTWKISAPTGLPSMAYPFTVKAGSGKAAGQFYACYFYAAWLETRDMGSHWYPITRGTLSNMQTPSLLTDPSDPNHLFLGGDQGLYESHDDGKNWLRISAIYGNVQSMIATNTAPRILYCATDQGFYRWKQGSKQITQIEHLPMTAPPTRLLVDAIGHVLYGLSGQELWFSSDGGSSWDHRWHFDQEDLVALVVDPLNPRTLYAGFFLPPRVVYSTDGGSSWLTLTN
jgi:photosystem II stability/assembly factor-like uncharacterized protein